MKTRLKNMISKLLTICLMLLLLLGAATLSAEAAGITGEEKVPGDAGFGFTYAFVSPTTIEITSYDGYEREVNIPAAIDGYTVVGIQNFRTGYAKPNAFVQKVILPETVTYIADDAFYDEKDWSAQVHSELREIVLNEGLKTIGERAFYNNSYLKKIEIPSSVTEIGKDAFASCSDLSDITFKGSNTFLHGGAFNISTGKINKMYEDWLYDNSSDDFLIWQGQLIAYKGTGKTPVIPDTVSVIGAGVFRERDITKVTIPSSVQEIGDAAFYNCTSLSAVDIPGSVKRIDDSAFSGCSSMKSVTFHEGLEVIGDGSFRECESLNRLDLPEGLTTLEDTAFYDCINIEDFTFPASLGDMECSSIYTSKWYENLPDGAELYCGSVFLGCKNEGYPEKLTVRPGTKMVRIENSLRGVKELNLPEGLESLIIPDAGTDSCSITSLTVPESVNYIDLNNMSELTDIKLPETAVLANDCFAGCYKIKNLVIPRGNITLNGVNVGRTANVVLPDDVLEVNGPISNGRHGWDDISSGNSTLKSIDFKNVRILTNGALANCIVLDKVTLPDSLITLGMNAFRNCRKLRSIEGGGNVRQIGICCFADCSELDDFGDLEKSVRNVGTLAFLDTDWFHDQPNGVVYFGKAAYAYKGTMAKDTVLNIKEGTVFVSYEFLAGQKEVNPNFDQPNLAGIILPQSCKYIDGYAFAGAGNMKFTDLGGAIYIGDSAFNDNACETIVLPDSVRFVGNNAFSAANIRAVHLNEGLQALDEGAFFSYGAGKGIKVPASVEYIGPQAIGYCPVDPDNPFAGTKKIDGFVVGGEPGSVAQSYAKTNEFDFETSVCTAHQPVTETVDATCQTGGFTCTVCAVCGTVTESEKTAVVAHKAVANDKIEATCTGSGYTGGTHCIFCGKTITEPQKTPALGHDWVIALEEYPGSAYTGMTRYYCRRCTFTWHEENESGHVHNYDYCMKTVYATCKAGGYTEHICACGAKYRDNLTPALAHNYKTTTKKATTAKDGEIVSSCTECGKVRKTTPIYKISSVRLLRTSCVYNGKRQKPSVIVKTSKGEKLEEGKDYIASYQSGRKKVGKYEVQISFKGQYSGKKILDFTIRPKGTAVSKVTAKSKGFAVAWSRQPVQTTGYQIQYSVSSKFKNAKNMTVPTSKNTKRKVSKLKGGSRYHVRIRTYKTVNVNGKKNKIYSSWSKGKSVVTKR